MSDGLPTDLIIAAQIRTAAKEGVPITVRHRGDSSSGVIILKINRLNGTAHVLMQARYDEELVWSPVSRDDPMSEADAELYLKRQIDIDPDSWILEIEDHQGRHWFPERIVKLRS
jgi:hypothetical protein